jgi:hypothetical protein
MAPTNKPIVWFKPATEECSANLGRLLLEYWQTNKPMANRQADRSRQFLNECSWILKSFQYSSLSMQLSMGAKHVYRFVVLDTVQDGCNDEK